MGLFETKISLVESGVMHGASDCHSHILFGVDDGIGTLEESLRAIAAEEAMGVSEIWCTPHVMEDIPNETDDLMFRFEHLRAAYTGKVRLRLAAEYMIDTLMASRLAADDLLTMDDDVLLVETSVWLPPMDLSDRFRDIQKKGYTPMLAHPERYSYMGRGDYQKYFNMGVRFQLNLPSVAGCYGRTACQKASWMLEQQMYSSVGTDCHRTSSLDEPYSGRFVSRADAENLMNVVK